MAQRRLAEQWPRWMGLALAACALWPMLGRGHSESQRAASPHEWPRVWQGDTLRPLALTAVEQRFAERFPGHIGRFAADGSIWVLRDVTQPTRALHPASDCFRGLGYRIEQAQLQRAERRSPVAVLHRRARRRARAGVRAHRRCARPGVHRRVVMVLGGDPRSLDRALARHDTGGGAVSTARPFRRCEFPWSHEGAPAEPWGTARSAKGAQ